MKVISGLGSHEEGHVGADECVIDYFVEPHSLTLVLRNARSRFGKDERFSLYLYKLQTSTQLEEVADDATTSDVRLKRRLPQ